MNWQMYWIAVISIISATWTGRAQDGRRSLRIIALGISLMGLIAIGPAFYMWDGRDNLGETVARFFTKGE